ncbi:MAG TPA: S41 family peptidase, partial [Candidatus Saccharimonadales bacterium]|nr:S41 family peptidase [Candidatus Saccharimonadales bacterium]
MKKQFQFNLTQIAAAAAVCLVLGAGIGAKNPSWHWGRVASNQPDFTSLSSLYDTLQKKFDGTLDPNKILEGARAGLVGATGDPYTSYLTAEEARQLQDSLDGTISGIGIEIGIKNNHLTVIAPVAGTPADKAGLAAGDIIAAIDGADSSQLSLDQAVSKIRGAKGTQVKLTIIHGSQASRDVTITRDVITVSSVKSEIKPGNIGYIQVTQFGSDTASAFAAAAAKMKQAGVNKIILDLRSDPGGYLDAAQSLASHFLPSGQGIVQERRGSTVTETLRSTGGDLEDVKLV